jgi:hypothetical protein
MYIEEKRSLEEIMEYMKEHHKFSPRSVAATLNPPTPPYKHIVITLTTCALLKLSTMADIILVTANVHSRLNSNVGNFRQSRILPIRMPSWFRG